MTRVPVKDRLGPYVLREPLGQGPAGTVYRATESDTGREVALKVVALMPESAEDSLLRDLKATNDLQIATSLRHPGIVRVHRIDAIGEFTATDMEYVRGMSLRDLLGIVGRLLPERAVAIACQILDALSYSHARRAVHRDLKPANILIRHDGLVKVTDFGFRNTCPDPASVHALPCHSYAAPEELDPDTTPDRRGDIWSVAVVLFQMLTGRLPFPISDPHDQRAWQRGLKSNTAYPLSFYFPDANSSLQDALTRALHYEADDRFQNGREFLNALLATGLCAGMAENEEEDEERQEATVKRIDKRLRAEIDAGEETALPELLRAFSQSNPDWEESSNLLHYAGVLQAPSEEADAPEPRAIALTPEEVDHLEEIETRLKSLLTPKGAPRNEPDSSAADARAQESSVSEETLDRTWSPRLSPADPSRTAAYSPELPPEAPPTNSRDGAELVLVPAGDFIMGSDGFSEDNAPRRIVTLDAFIIYRYPVTVGQYRLYCEDTAYPMPFSYWQSEDRDPIVGVTWQEALSYCEWAGVRLPTEAQWEKAARGTDGQTFPWGNQFDQRSSHRLIPKNAGKTTAVGNYPSGASPYGVMDMVGNVQQWCLDLYDNAYYKSAPAANPPGPPAGTGHRATKSGLVQRLFNRELAQAPQGSEQCVVRGSSWKDHHESFAYVFRREAFAPGVRLPWVGFRCVAASVPSPIGERTPG